MPGNVATVLDKPMRMLANWGAISKWFTLKPAQAKPPNPTATVRLATTALGVVECATASRNSV
jgi:hypothetical protein